jgi:hypothetical protein
MLAPWVKAMKPSPSARQGFVQRTLHRVGGAQQKPPNNKKG